MDGSFILNFDSDINIYNIDAKRRKAKRFEFHLFVTPQFKSYKETH